MIEYLNKIYKQENQHFIDGEYSTYIPLGLMIIHYNSVKQYHYNQYLISNNKEPQYCLDGLAEWMYLDQGYFADINVIWNLIKYAIEDCKLQLFDSENLPVDTNEISKRLELIKDGNDEQYSVFFGYRVSYELLLKSLPLPSTDIRIFNIMNLHMASYTDVRLSPEFSAKNRISIQGDLEETPEYKRVVAILDNEPRPKKKAKPLDMHIAIANLIWEMKGVSVKNPMPAKVWNEMKSIKYKPASEWNTLSGHKQSVASRIESIDDDCLIRKGDETIKSRTLKKASFTKTMYYTIIKKWPAETFPHRLNG